MLMTGWPVTDWRRCTISQRRCACALLLFEHSVPPPRRPGQARPAHAALGMWASSLDARVSPWAFGGSGLASRATCLSRSHGCECQS